MSQPDGYVYRLAWANPYTNPPDGKRILAEMFVLRDGTDGARGCPAIEALPRPRGSRGAIPPGCRPAWCAG